MKLYLLPVLFIALLLTGCDTDTPTDVASPLSVVPENAMITVILNDPAEMIRNIDGYIEEGAPLLGVSLLENLICAQLGISSLDSIPGKYGFNPSGQIAFWMESAMPTSMGMAVSAPDFPLFISLMEEMGLELTAEEPLSGAAVYSVDVENGTLYLTGVQGVALMAMSSMKLEALISALSSDASIQVPSASLTMNFNLSMIGPMAAAQMPMARMMMMQGMATDSTMPVFVTAIMDVYMDGIEAFLTQADALEITFIADTEDFVMNKRISFVPGTPLADMLVPLSGDDMLSHITQGDMATVSYRMPEEIAYEVTKAFSEVFTTELSDEMLHFWASLASNGAVSIYNDDFIHMVAAYEVTSDVSIEDIASMYAEYLGIVMPFIQQNPDINDSFNFQDNGIVSINGSDFYSMSMTILPDSTASMNFDYWMTIHDGALLLETAEEPVILLSIISGDYIPAELEGTGEMVGEMSLAGYMNMVMAMSPNGMDIPEIGSDVVFFWDGTYINGGISGTMSMDGSDAVAAGFAFAGLIAATQ